MSNRKNYIGLEINGWSVVAEVDKTWSHTNRKFIISDGNETQTKWLTQLIDPPPTKSPKEPKPDCQIQRKLNFETKQPDPTAMESDWRQPRQGGKPS